MLWGGNQSPPASFGPPGLELRILPLVPAMPPRTGVSVGWLYSGHWPQARQAPGTGPFLDFQGWGHPGSPQPPPHPERSGASDSAKGPGAVRFRGKGPQVGAAVAECEWFRWEITGDNPAQDGAARQETSSREPAAGWVGGGVPLGNRSQPVGQPQRRRGAVASCLMPPPHTHTHTTLLLSRQDTS